MSLSSLVDPSDLNGALQSMDDRLKALESTGIIPVGLCAYCAGVVPSGWLLMDGSTIQYTRYGQLVTYLGGTTSVVLPNAAGRVMVGKNAATFVTLLATGGVETVTLVAGNLPPVNWAAVAVPTAAPTTNVVQAALGAGVNITQGTSTPFSTLQPYIVLNPIIKF
jgi:microcystin-dependent protein